MYLNVRGTNIAKKIQLAHEFGTSFECCSGMKLNLDSSELSLSDRSDYKYWICKF